MKYTLSKFSHELRNPLTSLSCTLQFIEHQHPEVRAFKYWSSLHTDVEHMVRLLDQFSNLSKAERLELSTFSIHELLEQVSLSFAASIQQSNVQYTSKLDPSLSQITGDKTKLQEVFRNLLKNAYEASLPDKSIYLEAFQNDDFLTVSIHDTGCGIAPDRLDEIFQPFVTDKTTGTGLGLPICNQIVTAHQGTIAVTSAPNLGTTFRVSLPVNLHIL